jgi:threonine/homoserine/homoserine lactone efflux protein
MSVELYLAYLLACFVITIIPGPTVTLIVANSLAHGTRAGLLNVAGTQLGLGLMMLVLVVGLSSVIAAMGVWFDWLRLLGAAYLIWLGWKLLLRSTGTLDSPDGVPKKTVAPRGGFFMQGFLVLLGNPKALLWFGAFIPQFVDPSGDYVWQVILLGLTAMATAAISDGGYAVLAGGARTLLSRSRVRIVSRFGGLCLIGGGAWLALTRAR